jgi:hypothetical protein
MAVMSKEQMVHAGTETSLHDDWVATSVPACRLQEILEASAQTIISSTFYATTFTTPTHRVRWLLRPTKIHLNYCKDVK